MQYPQSIRNLIAEFSKLPTVGPKTAERFVFYLLKKNNNDLKKFADAITNLRKNINICKKCHSVAESDPCHICQDPKRDSSVLCIVSNTRELLSIESSREYSGYYYVLGGVLNAIEGIEPKNLNINPLLEKLKKEKVKEIIIALSPDMNGETTAMYLLKILKPFNIKISRIAKGLPSGASLEYADEITLANAMKYRNNL